MLGRVGVQVRIFREAREWTQAELARQSGLSVRFLADVERGEGNASLLRLGELAQALGVSLAALVATAGPVDDAVSEFARLDQETRDRLVPRRGARVALVGLRGAGKSSVGPLLAERLGARFVEVDQAIEQRAGLALAAIFEYHGAERYRALEREVLDGLLAGEERVVLATGGGVVTDGESWGALRQRSRTIWLRASPENHLRRVEAQGDVRPMRGRADALAELREILRVRNPLYGRAEVEINTDGYDVEGVVQELVRRIA